MKKVMIIILFTIFINNISSQEIWKITSLDWQPYSGAEISNQGNSIQKLRDLLQQADITLRVEFYPWLRGQNIARKEPGYLGYFPAWPEEVAEGFIASLPVDWSEISVMANSGMKITFNNIDELFKKYKVGIVSTYTYPIAIENAMKKYPQNVYKFGQETSLLKTLSNGTTDTALTDPNVMLYLASNEGISNIEYIKTIARKELVIAVKDNVENRKKLVIINKLLK